MKFRRIAVVLALALGLFSRSAFAQPMLDYKVIGGIGFGTMSFDDEGESEFFDGQRTGLIIGGGVGFPLGDMFSMTIEALYNQKGASGEGSTLKFDYIEIPILFTFPFNTSNPNMRPFVYAGVAPAFEVSAKQTFDDFDEEDEIDSSKSFDNAIVFGGGVRFGQMAAEARYNLGVQNINDGGDGDVKNRQFALLFSYFFGGR